MCVWQHLFTFIQYKFPFPCVKILTCICLDTLQMEIEVHPAPSSNNACQFLVVFCLSGDVSKSSRARFIEFLFGFFSSACLLSFPLSSFASCQVIRLLFILREREKERSRFELQRNYFIFYLTSYTRVSSPAGMALGHPSNKPTRLGPAA